MPLEGADRLEIMDPALRENRIRVRAAQIVSIMNCDIHLCSPE
jgi:hypothetical protein